MALVVKKKIIISVIILLFFFFTSVLELKNHVYACCFYNQFLGSLIFATVSQFESLI